jgi:transposase
MTVVEHHSVEELQELFRREKDARVAKRMWIVWQARAGLTEPQITASIGLARRTVQTWVPRDNEKGLAGLRDRGGRGRKPILSPEEQQAVAQRLEAGPQEGDVCSLRGLDFQKFIEDQFGKLMSLSAVYDLLHDLGYEWLVPRSKHRKSDPDEMAAFKKKSPKNSRRFKPNIRTSRSSFSFKMSADSVSRGH